MENVECNVGISSYKKVLIPLSLRVELLTSSLRRSINPFNGSRVLYLYMNVSPSLILRCCFAFSP